ncbi:unnamed protein product, partial [Discosporangium mesarthrocarpum]
ATGLEAAGRGATDGGGASGARRLMSSLPAGDEGVVEVEEVDLFRMSLLEAVLGLYSNHPLNYSALELRYHCLSFFLCALPYYESMELKGLALKTLEVICVSFKDVHPRDALLSTSTAFTVCLDHMLGLLSDPGSSPGGNKGLGTVALIGG